jgi:hypothetical protein
MNDYQIMIIRVSHRINSADKLQKVFTQYGCNVKTRLGLHEAGEACGVDGLIILQLVKGVQDNIDFMNDLNAIEGITAKRAEI